MKKILMSFACKSLIAGVVLAAVAGCNDAELKPIDNAAYIAEAFQATSTALSLVNDESAQTTITARLGDRAASDFSFRFEVSPEVLTRYNELNGTSYQIFPDGSYDLPSEAILIKAGEVSAAPVQVGINAYSEEMKSSGITYALPVRLVSTDGKIQVLNDNSEFVIICNWSKISPAPVFNSEFVLDGDASKKNRIMCDFGNDITFSAYTVEFMMYMYGVSPSSNQMFLGLEGSTRDLTNRLWVRFENGAPESNLMLINSMKKPGVDASTPNEVKKWQHIAVTYDGSNMYLYLEGKLVATKTAPNPSINFRYFSLLPQPSGFTEMASFREVRLWNVTRTATQLANNATGVDPNSEGLLLYWKMDEGSGYTFKDATGNGYDGTCQYSDAQDIGNAAWVTSFSGEATGLKWVEDCTQMDLE